ncbi:succinic semialdehyde dehydrogenase [Patulibacter sp.]|uniref:succinic semialdehyde dehydrogenase n=1 Tax=Patulibacter sp. TaxID=1912859 RepID=UPI00271650E8|nr:succinic semialdehyde dehydrogenase [Patulibacter sp.]MDO9409100.1 succinic semialdehyde dehydrogenase [Patulibacter sp.]
MSTQEQAPDTADGSAVTDPATPPQKAVVDPATGRTIAWVDQLGPEAAAVAAARGRAVQPAWEALGFEGRARVMRRAQKWVTEHSDELVATIVSETGKAWEDAQMAEVMYAASAFGHWADHAEGLLADERIKVASPLMKGKKVFTRHAPLGLVGVIAPWNYPFVNGFGDCIPALMAGNSVLLKPAEKTPLTSLLMARVLRECGLPDGVFQVLTGKGSVLGEALVDVVDMIMFTGSTPVGRTIGAQAGRRLIPCSLELGGKDPFIVLADADLERAANHALFYSMFNTGQTCISVERVYVEAPVYDEFVAKVTKKAKALRNGTPTGPGTTDVGALTIESQVATVSEHVEDARKKGATIVAGGDPDPNRPGWWYPPTVLTGVDHSMECMTEETFGPTLPIMKVADAEEAIRLANDSPYGLMASVFTKDTVKGEQIARRIQAGSVHVNDALIGYTALEAPMGGWKDSGLGARHGAPGIRKYTNSQTIIVSKYHLKKEPQVYPYTGRSFKLLGRVTKFFYGRGTRD